MTVDLTPCLCGTGKPMLEHHSSQRHSFARCNGCLTEGAKWHWPPGEPDYQRNCSEARLLWNIAVQMQVGK